MRYRNSVASRMVGVAVLLLGCMMGGASAGARTAPAPEPPEADCDLERPRLFCAPLTPAELDLAHAYYRAFLGAVDYQFDQSASDRSPVAYTVEQPSGGKALVRIGPRSDRSGAWSATRVAMNYRSAARAFDRLFSADQIRAEARAGMTPERFVKQGEGWVSPTAEVHAFAERFPAATAAARQLVVISKAEDRTCADLRGEAARIVAVTTAGLQLNDDPDAFEIVIPEAKRASVQLDLHGAVADFVQLNSTSRAVGEWVEAVNQRLDPCFGSSTDAYLGIKKR